MESEIKTTNPEYTSKLIEVLRSQYRPAGSLSEADEMLTTTELIEQISAFADTTREIIMDAMQEAGFKLHYTGAGYVWLLKAC